MKTFNFIGSVEIGSIVNIEDKNYEVIKNISENGFNKIVCKPL